MGSVDHYPADWCEGVKVFSFEQFLQLSIKSLNQHYDQHYGRTMCFDGFRSGNHIMGTHGSRAPSANATESIISI